MNKSILNKLPWVMVGILALALIISISKGGKEVSQPAQISPPPTQGEIKEKDDVLKEEQKAKRGQEPFLF